MQAQIVLVRLLCHLSESSSENPPVLIASPNHVGKSSGLSAKMFLNDAMNQITQS